MESIAAEAESDGIEGVQKGKGGRVNCKYNVLVAVYECGAEVEGGGYDHSGCRYYYVYNRYGWSSHCRKDFDKSFYREKDGHQRKCDWSDDTFCYATLCH
ncbi:MAG: hypothetical protein J6T70_15685 [Bacteroidales bacterium]|nr:hypothetical protein [Bacteroidales bacterium]